MQKITVVIRVDAGAVIITPEIVESALNTYLAENGNVTVFQAAQHSVQSDECPHCHAKPAYTDQQTYPDICSECGTRR